MKTAISKLVRMEGEYDLKNRSSVDYYFLAPVLGVHKIQPVHQPRTVHLLLSITSETVSLRAAFGDAIEFMDLSPDADTLFVWLRMKQVEMWGPKSNTRVDRWKSKSM
jgi:hypothetical protein